MKERVLLISPQPFFQWRGSPIRVRFNVQALAESGLEVDLLTLPIGEELPIEGVNVIRVWNPFNWKQISIGPSLPKLFFDLLIFLKGLKLIFTHRYKVVHGIEETGMIAVLLARLNGTKAIFEKHSDPMSYNKGGLKTVILKTYAWVEKVTVGWANGVICTGPGLEEQVKGFRKKTPVFHIFDIPSSLVEPDPERVAPLKQELRQMDDEVLVCFVGSFATYQGVDLMFDAIPKVVEGCPEARFLIIGGTEEEIDERKAVLDSHNVAHAVTFLGKIPPDDLPHTLAAADVLLSPRSSGVNTPLKLLDYFKAGGAIVATDIASNRLILNESNSVLTWPTPEQFAHGITSLVKDPEQRQVLGQNGHQLYLDRYNFTEYKRLLSEAYSQVCIDR